jgi:uncharacterized protein (DUF1778 family)
MNDPREHDRARAAALAVLARNRGEIDAKRLARLLARLDRPVGRNEAAALPVTR